MTFDGTNNIKHNYLLSPVKVRILGSVNQPGSYWDRSSVLSIFGDPIHTDDSL